MDFSVSTFNVLAPCYNRLGPGIGLEQRDVSKYTLRFRRLLDEVLHHIHTDVLCLQEFWFNADIEKMFEDKFGSHFTSHFFKRPGRKQDGLAILVNKRHHVSDVQVIPYGGCGSRVGMFVEIEVAGAGKVLVATTHLSFANTIFDDQLRYQQARSLISFLDSYLLKNNMHRLRRNERSNGGTADEPVPILSSPSTSHLSSSSPFPSSPPTTSPVCRTCLSLPLLLPPVILCGDFNGGVDAVFRLLLRAGYHCSFSAIHGRHVGVTHRNHKGEAVPADYVFYAQKKICKCHKAGPSQSLLADAIEQNNNNGVKNNTNRKDKGLLRGRSSSSNLDSSSSSSRSNNRSSSISTVTDSGRSKIDSIHEETYCDVGHRLMSDYLFGWLCNQSGYDDDGGARGVDRAVSNGGEVDNDGDGTTGPLRIEPVSSVLFPRHLPDMEWPAEFDVSDHRPLTTSFRLHTDASL